MSYIELLGRKSEILKRNIDKMLVKNNKSGLAKQESQLLQKLIKEYHQNEYELNAGVDPMHRQNRK